MELTPDFFQQPSTVFTVAELTRHNNRRLNDECRMTNDEGMTKPELTIDELLIRHSSFVFVSSFVIRHSSFS
jgi:hypothetical protein